MMWQSVITKGFHSRQGTESSLDSQSPSSLVGSQGLPKLGFKMGESGGLSNCLHSKVMARCSALLCCDSCCLPRHILNLEPEDYVQKATAGTS